MAPYKLRRPILVTRGRRGLLVENQSKICYASLDALFENRKGPGDDSQTALFGGKVFFPWPAGPCYPQQIQPGGLHSGAEAQGLESSAPELFDPREPVPHTHGSLHPGAPAVGCREQWLGSDRALPPRTACLSRLPPAAGLRCCILAVAVSYLPLAMDCVGGYFGADHFFRYPDLWRPKNKDNSDDSHLRPCTL
jgi:hypothetical protein